MTAVGPRNDENNTQPVLLSEGNWRRRESMVRALNALSARLSAEPVSGCRRPDARRDRDPDFVTRTSGLGDRPLVPEDNKTGWVN